MHGWDPAQVRGLFQGNVVLQCLHLQKTVQKKHRKRSSKSDNYICSFYWLIHGRQGRPLYLPLRTAASTRTEHMSPALLPCPVDSVQLRWKRSKFSHKQIKPTSIYFKKTSGQWSFHLFPLKSLHLSSLQ